MLKKLILLILLSVCSFSYVYSQPKEGEMLEKIVAVVGNEVITLTDLNSSMMMYLQASPQMNIQDPTERERVMDSLYNDPDMRKKVLDALINEKLVVEQAKQDSVTISDDEVEQRWDYQLQQYVAMYGSEKRIEDIFGMSISQIHNEARDIIKKKLLAEKMQQIKLADVKVTPREVEEFYKNFKDSLQNIPEEVEIYHLVKYVEASNNAREKVLELARKVRDSILNGGDFASFAKRYSDDKATADSGGNLGWFPKGRLIREFEKAAFELQPGQISVPVETPFGFHIIQCIDKNKDSILTRHILFKIGGSTEDIEKTKDYLRSFKDSLAKGKSFEDMAKLYSDETETKGFGGFIIKSPISKLPPEIEKVVEKLHDGEISEPLIYSSSQNKTAYHIIYRKKTIPSHFPTLDKDYNDIQDMALNYKKMTIYQSWINELRSKLYWEIKK